MGSDGGSTKTHRIHPPVYFLAGVVLMLALNYLVPVARVLAYPWNMVGLVPLVGGFAMGSWGAGLFLRRRTPMRPFKQATKLVTDGPFRFTRNPMYLGLACALVGIAMLLGSVTPWVVVPLFVLAVGRWVIPFEEAMLEETYGDEYAGYKRRVRRWV